MSKNDDLEKTMPINIINDEENDENLSRSKKYKNVLEDEDDELTEISEEEKDQLEQAEEALAEKNIAEAEALLAKEENKEPKDKKKKVSLIKKIKNKWQKMSKKQKIFTIIGLVLLLIIIISLIVFLIIHFTKKPVEQKKEEVAPKIVDNFYYKDGRLYILDENEKEIGSYECHNKSAKQCYVAINKYRDNFDVPKNLDKDEKEKVERIPVYNKDYVFIYDNKDEDDNIITLYSLEDKKTKKKYKDVKAYDEDMIIYQDDESNYGIMQINKKVSNIIDSSENDYNYMGMINGQNNIIAQNDRGYIIIDKNNKTLSGVINTTDDIKYYSDKLIVTADKLNNYSVYDYKGNLLIDNYKYITVLNNYIFLVDNYNKLFIRDNNKTKYNEEGITLNNTDYVTSYIYDKKGDIDQTKSSFEVEFKGSLINVLTYTSDYQEGDYVNLNINEALSNKNLDYHNYFDGKIYFYSDKSKETLLGSYVCNNKNSINSSSDSLNTCYPAKDTIFEDNDMIDSKYKNRKSTIPIMNNRYVFITDGNGTVNLYDLSESKTKGTYNSVNTYSEENNYKLTHKNGTFNIIGLNKKNLYGMINITGNSVTGQYAFQYKKLEKMGNYIAGLTSDNKGVLIFNKNSLSVKYPGPIRGYIANGEYVKIKDNNSYYVYNSKGEKIGKNSFKYVELYDSFYAGVDNDNKLMIYDYNGEELIENKVTLSSTTFIQTDNPSFKITRNSNEFIISIYKNNKYETVKMNEVIEQTE